MAEHLSNGTAPSADVEMKEETAGEVRVSFVFSRSMYLTPVQANLDDIQPTPQADLTDPNPPPQPAPVPAPQSATEHLSTIQPGAVAARATPPVVSNPAARPASIPLPPAVKLEKPVAHGGQTRQYLNQYITPHLLEAMKHLAVYEPEKPLLWLADFLRDKSKEIGE